MYYKLVYRCFSCPRNVPDPSTLEDFLILNEVASQKEQDEMQHTEAVPKYEEGTQEIWGLCSKHREEKSGVVPM